MTRDEATFYIKELQKTYASMDKKIAEAIDMATEALSTDSKCNNCKEYGSHKCTRCDGEIYFKADGDLISRQEAIHHVCYECESIIRSLPSAEPVHLTEIDMESWTRGYEQGKLWAKADMKREAEPVRGEWMKWTETIEDDTGVAYIPHWKCSVCETEYDPYFANTINYCPNCGTKMKGGAK